MDRCHAFCFAPVSSLYSLITAAYVPEFCSCIVWPKVVDCRICGDPNSVLRFAFIEFTDEGIVTSFCCVY